MSQEISENIFCPKPGQVSALLNAYDQLDFDMQAQILLEINENGDSAISTALIDQELVTLGIAENTNDSLTDARKKAKILLDAADNIPGIKGLLGLLADDGENTDRKL